MHYMGHSIEFDDNKCIKCTKCVMRCKTCSVGYLEIKVDENGKKQSGKASYLENTSMGNYIVSAHYADAALGEFIQLLKDNDLTKNTIIILYGDHEARLAKKQFNLL